MKHVKHDNLLPFYGVSTTVSDFCLVFPWYESGNIMDYLKKKPDINRFDLVNTFRQTARSRCSLVLTNSYWMRLADCVFCTKIVWFTAA